MIKPRGWQVGAFRKFGATKEPFLVEATPGAGKTIFSALCAKHALDTGAVDFCVIVVPTTALKGDADAGFMGDWNKVGVQICTVLKDGHGRPKEYSGAVVTYQQLGNLVSTFKVWCGNGVRLMFVFDEVHHASDSNTWGSAVDACGEMATRVLAMSGTPFRGDGARIKFVRYDEDGVAQADHKYGYLEAVKDRVCRPVQFMTDDGLAQYVINEIEEEVRLSEANDANVGPASAAIFKADSEWLRRVIEKADARLDDYRVFDRDAGGIVICRPGADDNDDRHLHQVAKLIRQVTGEAPEVITHDDADANTKIEKFRKGDAKWICSVRKISEGVDIKRLRVMVMANRPGTELLFRQLVGRVVRVEDNMTYEDATVFLAKFPQLVKWAEQISEEAEGGLKERKESRQRNEGLEREESSFIPLGATHEDGGGVSEYGEAFNRAEIDFAEHWKRGDPQLANVPVTAIAHLVRKIGVSVPDEQPVQEPLAVQKKRVRSSINNKARNLAYQHNPEKPDFSAVWRLVFTHTGARSLDDLCDNHSIEKMRQVEHLLARALGGQGNAEAA